MNKDMNIPVEFIRTSQSTPPLKATLDETRIPQMCASAAQSYSAGILAQDLLNSFNESGVSFDKKKCSISNRSNIEISLLSSLIIKHQLMFEAFKLSILPALKGESLRVMPNWELDQQKRIILIQVLDLLSNMVRRRMFPNSSLIATGFVAALELLESLDIEERASYLPYCRSLIMQRVIKVTDNNGELATTPCESVQVA
ncbi:hypothetical protein [Vibrio hangzhouensis]|nr:hypothetical protein [Vibrio hangzhouensis]